MTAWKRPDTTTIDPAWLADAGAIARQTACWDDPDRPEGPDGVSLVIELLVAKLDEPIRTAVTMRASGLSYEQIAEHMVPDVGRVHRRQVQRWVSYGLRDLRATLTSESWAAELLKLKVPHLKGDDRPTPSDRRGG